MNTHGLHSKAVTVNDLVSNLLQFLCVDKLCEPFKVIVFLCLHMVTVHTLFVLYKYDE